MDNKRNREKRTFYMQNSKNTENHRAVCKTGLQEVQRHRKTDAATSGRKPKPITQEESDAVMALRKEHPAGVVNLERIFDKQGRHMPHNPIHRILIRQGLAKTEPKKSKRRKWVRYERLSLSLTMLQDQSSSSQIMACSLLLFHYFIS